MANLYNANKLAVVRRKIARVIIPTVRRGNGGWCGKFLIISAPPAISQWFGRGEIGLELYRSLHRK